MPRFCVRERIFYKSKHYTLLFTCRVFFFRPLPGSHAACIKICTKKSEISQNSHNSYVIFFCLALSALSALSPSIVQIVQCDFFIFTIHLPNGFSLSTFLPLVSFFYSLYLFLKNSSKKIQASTSIRLRLMVGLSNHKSADLALTLR